MVIRLRSKWVNVHRVGRISLMFAHVFVCMHSRNARSSASNARSAASASTMMRFSREMQREEEQRAPSPSSLSLSLFLFLNLSFVYSLSYSWGVAHRVGVWLIYGLLSVCNNRRLYPPLIHPAINNRPLRSPKARVCEHRVFGCISRVTSLSCKWKPKDYSACETE